MNKSNASILSCTAAISAIIAFGNVPMAYAQEASEASEASANNDIVVTAQRREQSLRDVPQAVQALGGDDLLRANIENIEDTIAMIPSATSGAAISPGATTFQIRGVAASETDGDPTVGYYLDNFAFSMPGRPYAPVADFYDIERVEVLRGPSGTLYGLGSLGGTIKVLTRDPDLEEYEGAVRVTGTTTTGGEEGGSVDLMLNSPIIPGRLAIRAVGTYRKLGGYADSIPNGTKNVNDNESFTGRIKLLAKPTDELLIRLAYWRNVSRQNFSNRVTYFDPPRFDQTFGFGDSDYSLYTGDIEYDLGFATLSSTTGYIKNDVHNGNAGFIPLPIGNFVSDFPLLTKSFNEDVRLTSNGNGPLSYIVGFFYQSAKTSGGQSAQLPDSPLVPGNVGIITINDNELKSKAFAFYGEATYGLVEDKLDLTIGGRYFKEKRTFVENSSLELVSLGVLAPVQETVRFKSNTFNPRFNIAFHPNSDGMIYAEVAKGFRSGAITSNAIMATANLAMGTNLPNASPPDTLWNYEAGVKWSLFDRVVNLELSGYYFDWANAQIELSPTTQSIVAPVGNVEGLGLDATLSVNPTRELTIQLSGNINRTRLQDVNPSIAAALPWVSNGRQLPGTSKRTLAASASYETPLGGTGMDLRLNARYNYRSNQQSIFDGRYAPSLHMVSARAGVGNDNFEIALFADNLTNELGPISAPGGQFVVPYPQTFGISLETRF